MFGSDVDCLLTIQGPEFRSIPRAFLIKGYEGIPDLPRAVLEYCGQARIAALDLNAISAAIAENVSLLLQGKIASRQSKFSYLLGKESHFRVELDKNLRVSIFDSVSGNDIRHGFEAYGERWVLYMATARALRPHIFGDWDFPFVMGSLSNGLNRRLGQSILEFAPSMSGQVILFESEEFYETIKTRPHFRLSCDEHSGAFHLIKARGDGASPGRYRRTTPTA